jgi:hypothetical protein
MRMAVRCRGAAESSHFSSSFDLRGVNPNREGTGNNREEPPTNSVQHRTSQGALPRLCSAGLRSKSWSRGPSLIRRRRRPEGLQDALAMLRRSPQDSVLLATDQPGIGIAFAAMTHLVYSIGCDRPAIRAFPSRHPHEAPIGKGGGPLLDRGWARIRSEFAMVRIDTTPLPGWISLLL